MGKYSSFKCSR